MQAQHADSEVKEAKGTDTFQNIPLPSIADEEAPHILDPKDPVGMSPNFKKGSRHES